jgi:hypothetical protein
VCQSVCSPVADHGLEDRVSFPGTCFSVGDLGLFRPAAVKQADREFDRSSVSSVEVENALTLLHFPIRRFGRLSSELLHRIVW